MRADRALVSALLLAPVTVLTCLGTASLASNTVPPSYAGVTSVPVVIHQPDPATSAAPTTVPPLRTSSAPPPTSAGAPPSSPVAPTTPRPVPTSPGTPPDTGAITSPSPTTGAPLPEQE